MMPPPMDSSMDEILAAFDKDLDKIDTRFSEKTKTQQGLCLGWTSECLSEQRRFAHEIAVECQLREAEALSSSDDDEDVVDPLPLGFRPPKPKYAPAHVRSGGPTDYSSQSRQIVCYRCGGTGHIARDCDLT